MRCSGAQVEPRRVLSGKSWLAGMCRERRGKPPPKGVQFSTTGLPKRRRLSHSSSPPKSALLVLQRTSSNGKKKNRDTAHHCRSYHRYQYPNGYGEEPHFGYCQHCISDTFSFYARIRLHTELTRYIHSMNATARLPSKRYAISLCYLHFYEGYF